MTVKSITVTAGVKRSRDYQVANYEISEEVDLEPGDDPVQAAEAIRGPLFKQVSEYTEKLIDRIAGPAQP